VNKWSSGISDKATGKDLGVENAKQVWADELAGFAGQPERIKQALQACADMPSPPSLADFKRLCRAERSEPVRALPAPNMSDAELSRRREQAERMKKVKFGEPGIGWALALREKYLSRVQIPGCSIAAASGVLGEVWSGHECKPKRTEESK